MIIFLYTHYAIIECRNNQLKYNWKLLKIKFEACKKFSIELYTTIQSFLLLQRNYITGTCISLPQFVQYETHVL